MAYGAAADASAKYPRRISYLIGADGRIERAVDVGGDIVGHIEDLLKTAEMPVK